MARRQTRGQRPRRRLGQLLYVASPLPFSEAGGLFYARELLPSLIAAGFRYIDPWTFPMTRALKRAERLRDQAKRQTALMTLNNRVAMHNADAIDRADAMLAVLDGADVDSGTAAEIGYAYAQGKVIVGYRGDSRRSGENEGYPVNLQVGFFIHASGGSIVRSHRAIAKALRSAFRHRILRERVHLSSGSPVR